MSDAPDGLINAHVVRSRRPDHVAPKAAKVKSHEPAPKAAAVPAADETVKAEVPPPPTPAKTPAKKSAAQPKK